MKFRNQFLKYYMDKADDGSQSGGSGGEGSTGGEEPTTYTQEQYSALETEKSELLKESMKRKEKIQGLESQLSSFEGIDVELYKTMLSERKDAESKKKEAEEKILLEQGKFEELLSTKVQEHEGILTQVRDQHDQEIKDFQEKLTTANEREATLLAQIEELTVGTAFGNSKFIREDMVSAMNPARVRALYGKHFESDANGQVIGYDKPTGVEGRAPIVDKNGKNVSFDAALKTILENEGDYDSMIRNKASGSGSGSKGNGLNGEDQRTIGSGLSRITHALNKESQK